MSDILAVYDNSEYIDRFTIVLNPETTGYANASGDYNMIGMAKEIYHPTYGFCQHSSGTIEKSVNEPQPHLGKKITYDKLPQQCRNWLESNYQVTNK